MIAKELLKNIEGVGIFPMISLILFFVLFTAIIIHAFMLDKKATEDYAAIPLSSSKDQDHE